MGLISLAVYLAAVVVWVPQAYELHRRRALVARIAELEKKTHCAAIGNCPLEKLALAKGLVEDHLASAEQAAEQYCRGTLQVSSNPARALQQIDECLAETIPKLR